MTAPVVDTTVEFARCEIGFQSFLTLRGFPGYNDLMAVNMIVEF